MPQHDLTPRLAELLGELSSRGASSIDLDDDLLEALDLDSLGALRVLAAIEKRFDVRFPDGQLAGLTTIRRLQIAIEQARRGEEPT